MQDLNEFIEHKYFENQKIEDKSKAVEARILALIFKIEMMLNKGNISSDSILDNS